jgi:hypothetical protein
MVGRAATILAGAMAKEVLVAHGDLGLYLASLRCKVIVEEGLWQTTSRRARLRGGEAFGWPAYTRRRGEIMKGGRVVRTRARLTGTALPVS